MRRPSLFGVLFLLAAGCGYNPTPKDGKLPCTEGCPSGYVCRADNFCWRTASVFPDGGMSVHPDGATMDAAGTAAVDAAAPDTGSILQRDVGPPATDTNSTTIPPGDATPATPDAAAGVVDTGVDAPAPDTGGRCAENATQCGDNGVQVCTGGQWGPATACGTRQTCAVTAGKALCTCAVDPICTRVGDTCESASKRTTCAQDAQGCFYAASATTCTNGACTGAPGSATCCTNACTAGSTSCLTLDSMKTCTVGANGCTVSTTAACAADELCSVDKCATRAKYKDVVGDCGILLDGTVNCWSGMLVAPTGTFTALAGYTMRFCGLTPDQSIACWGTTSGAPTSGSYTQISQSLNTGCALRTDKTPVCWGGYMSSAVIPSGAFTMVAAAEYHACGVKTDGTLACWISDAANPNTPYVVSELPTGSFSQVTAGTNFACAIRTDGTVVCWGKPTLTAGTSIAAPEGTFKQLTAGPVHVCGIKTDGTLACWGENNKQQISPLPSGTFIRIGAGLSNTCGIRSNNTVACWGGGFAPNDLP